MEREKDVLFVSSVARGIRVLEAFRDADESLGLTELAEKTGMTISAVQRFTHTWHRLGYLEKDPKTKHFRLTVSVLELGYLFLRSNPLVARATPHMVIAHAQHGVPMNLSILSGSDVIYIVRIPHRRLKLVEMLPGRRVPAFCNSAGRSLLSYLGDEELAPILARPKIAFTPRTTLDPAALMAEIQRVRQQGYAMTRDQVLLGQIGIGTVIFDADRNPIAAINMVMASDEWTEDQVTRELVPQLLETAHAITYER